MEVSDSVKPRFFPIFPLLFVLFLYFLQHEVAPQFLVMTSCHWTSGTFLFFFLHDTISCRFVGSDNDRYVHRQVRQSLF